MACVVFSVFLVVLFRDILGIFDFGKKWISANNFCKNREIDGRLQCAGTIRKTLPLEQGQLDRALTITSAGYAEPVAASPGYGMTTDVVKPVVVVDSPDIMIQPLTSPTAATTVFQMPQRNDALLTGTAFGQIYEA